jgi:hypothetical protein
MPSTTHTASRPSVGSVRWLNGLVVASIIGCAAVPVAGRQTALHADYVYIGEGVSSAAPSADAEFASRMFTMYLLDEACRSSRAGDVVRLRAQPSRLTLHVGEPFSPGSLKIAAIGAAGALLPKVPIAVELKSPLGVFDARDPWGKSGRLQQDLLAGGALMPLSPARVTFRFRTICPGPAAEVFVGADIRHR